MKPYSCCRKFHSLIDGLEQTTEGFTLDIDDIESITVRAPETAIGSHMMRRPDSVMAAQYSMPYIVGATLAYGPRRYDAYGADHHDDPKILSIVDRVEAVRDAEFDRLIPAKMATGVSLKLRGGGSREASVLDSLGTPVRPMSLAAVRDKARALIAEVDPDIDLDRIASEVNAMPTADGACSLADRLVAPGYDGQREGPKAA